MAEDMDSTKNEVSRPSSSEGGNVARPVTALSEKQVLDKDIATVTMAPESREGIDSASNVTLTLQPEADSASTRSKQMDEGNQVSDGNQETQETQYITGFQLYCAIASVTLVCFLMLLDTSIISTAIPKITDQFHSLGDVGWYGSAYQLASAALQPLTGKIYSHFSVKWCFLAFFGIFELGSLLCGVATSSTMLIVGRAVAGMGASGLMNGGLTILASCVPLERRALVTGGMMGFCQLGVAMGPLIGGAFTQGVTWRWCFYINLPIGGVVAIFLALIRIPELTPKRPPLEVLPNLHHHLDLLGFVLFAPAPIMLLLALQWGGSKYAWDSATIIGLFCGAGGDFIVWSIWNWRRGDDALLPLSVIRKRVVWSSSLTAMFIFCTLFTAAYFFPIYFQGVLDVTPITSGVNLLPSILTQLVGAVSSGVLVTKTGYPLPFAAFASAASCAGSGLFTLLQPDTSTAKWAGFQILAGGGRGVGMQMPIIAIQAVLQPSEIPLAMSLMMFLQSLGTSVFLTIANTVFDQTLVSQIHAQAPNANAELIVAAGATAYRNLVSAADLPGVVQAFANSVDKVFYVAVAAGAAGFFTSFGMGWVDIRKKQKPVGPAAGSRTPGDATPPSGKVVPAGEEQV